MFEYSKRLRQLRGVVQALGIRGAVLYFLAPRMLRGSGRDFWIKPKASHHALRIREGTSDIYVFHQVFLDREYDFLDGLAGAKLVIDCGANVGYTSAFFLSRFEGASLIAVEPDPGNYAVLVDNLKAFGTRATPLHAAVWSGGERLEVSSVRYRDGGEWSRQVRPAPSAAETSSSAADVSPSSLHGVDIGTLLERSEFERISILKVDIEGAEAVVFGPHCQSWLSSVDAIAIELHDDAGFGSGTNVFFDAIADQNFRICRQGELTLCVREARDGS